MESFSDRLDRIRADGLYRSAMCSSVSGAHIEIGGRGYLNCASNDYLGVSGRLDWQREFLRVAADNRENFIMGSSSSRLLGCNSEAFFEFEDFLSESYSRESGVEKKCLSFNCGFHANTGILPAIATSNDLIVMDKLSHASLIDALKLSDAKWVRFPHNDFSRLREILARRRGEFERVFIVTEAVFSMDGDVADIAELAAVKREFDAFLYVDEAHSFGLFGRCGLGLCAECGVLADVDLAMCTLGKAAGSEGAFCVSSPEVRELLVNRCRPFIFSTAIAPINAMWSKFVLEKIFEMDSERRRLREISERFRKSVSGVLGSTQISPVLLGSNARALSVSGKLSDDGIYAPAIRYPTVPKNSARVRISLTVAMSDAEVDFLSEKIVNAMGAE